MWLIWGALSEEKALKLCRSSSSQELQIWRIQAVKSWSYQEIRVSSSWQSYYLIQSRQVRWRSNLFAQDQVKSRPLLRICWSEESEDFSFHCKRIYSDCNSKFDKYKFDNLTPNFLVLIDAKFVCTHLLRTRKTVLILKLVWKHEV